MDRKLQTLCLLLSLCLLLPVLGCARQQSPSQENPTVPSPDNSTTAPPLRKGALRLCELGVSDWRVVVAKDASRDVRTMVDEFISYFQKITGVTLPLVTDAETAREHEIVIGKTTRTIDASIPYDQLGQEGYSYCANGKSVAISGNTDRAVAYGVYGFLEDCLGVLYLSAEYEYVPQKSTLDIASNLNFSDVPEFWYRDMGHIGHNDPVWMVKMRLNSRQSLGSENYRKTPFVGGGEGYADWFVHTIGKLAEMKPNEKGNYFNIQPCLTDEAVYQTVLKNVRNWLEIYPDATIVSISQNDGSEESSMCACDNCRTFYREHGSVQSALWIAFVSRVANELKDEYPTVHFETLSYNFTTMVPQGLTIPDNMIVRCGASFCCMNHPYSQCANAHGSAQQKKSSLFYDTLDQWTNLSDNIFIWEYATLFNNYWAPLVNYNTLQQNMAMYAEQGVKGVYIQGADNNAPLGELHGYLSAKLLWNPSMNEREFEQIKNEFLEHYYGIGTAEPLNEFITLMDSSINDMHYNLYGLIFEDYAHLDVYEDANGTHLDTSKVIDPAKDCFARAEALATDQEQKAHLQKALTQIQFYEVMALFKLEEKHENAVFDANYRRALGEQLFRAALSAGFTSVHEGGGNALPSSPNFDKIPRNWHQK